MLGQWFLRSSPWTLTLLGDLIAIDVAGSGTTVPLERLEGVSISVGIVWATISLRVSGRAPICVGAIANADARELIEALERERTRVRRAVRIEAFLSNFDQLIAPIARWADEVCRAARQELRTRGWLRAAFLQKCVERKPPSTLEALLGEPEVSAHLATKAKDVKNAISLWRRDFRSFADAVNERHVAAELQKCKSFFDSVEKSPLTEEQARAVVCFDARVQVIASAGSGKTSTMVAKAGYALHRGLVPAERILMLAFNADAAAELQHRIKARLAPLGFPADRIVARTFHAFGLDIIGSATGARPTLAPWFEQGGDVRKLSELVEELKTKDASFQKNWELFRVVFGRDLPKFGAEGANPEDWDEDTSKRGFRTLAGEIVKSRGERIIADWLFYNGVAYEYEPTYVADTADARHRQYRPDFYYPDISTYHEHWALDALGHPPAEFRNYLEGMEWKRECHRLHGTDLIETTMADLWSGRAFRHLENELIKRGIVLAPNPSRQAVGRPPMQDKDLVRLFRTFLTHAKSNRFSKQDLVSKIGNDSADRFVFRHALFLELYSSIQIAWEEALRGAGAIDFEDMLNLATDHLEAGRWKNTYELVMIDEFQDASLARARMTRALLAGTEAALFAVGDDWQSINRFAGADISVMTEFERWFGKSRVMRLERTFRCPQSLCEISSTFAQANPAQLRKNVRSQTDTPGPTLAIIQVDRDDEIIGAIQTQLYRISDSERNIAPDAKPSVLILGRYNQDAQYVPGTFPPGVDAEFMTIHGSKGLEADYVILARVVSGAYGFPSEIVDDPVLQLAMPTPEAFPHAEERRLLYVALTRARRRATVIAVAGRPSTFVAELAQTHGVQTLNVQGVPVTAQTACPRCVSGMLVPRTGQYGPFLGCTEYPECRYTQNRPTADQRHG